MTVAVRHAERAVPAGARRRSSLGDPRPRDRGDDPEERLPAATSSAPARSCSSSTRQDQGVDARPSATGTLAVEPGRAPGRGVPRRRRLHDRARGRRAVRAGWPPTSSTPSATCCRRTRRTLEGRGGTLLTAHQPRVCRSSCMPNVSSRLAGRRRPCAQALQVRDQPPGDRRHRLRAEAYSARDQRRSTSTTPGYVDLSPTSSRSTRTAPRAARRRRLGARRRRHPREGRREADVRRGLSRRCSRAARRCSSSCSSSSRPSASTCSSAS